MRNLLGDFGVAIFLSFGCGHLGNGDIDVVYGESSGYAGYHLVYFVGEGDLYSNVIARSDLSETALSDYLDGQSEALAAKLGYWAKLVG